MAKSFIRILAFLLSLGILLDPARSAAVAFQDNAMVHIRPVPERATSDQALTLALGGAAFSVVLSHPTPFLQVFHEYRQWITLALYGASFMAVGMVLPPDPAHKFGPTNPGSAEPEALEAMDTLIRSHFRDRSAWELLSEKWGYRVYAIGELKDVSRFIWQETFPLQRWLNGLGMSRENLELTMLKYRGPQVLNFRGDESIVYIMKELAGNIFKHGGSRGLLLIRQDAGHLEILARDMGSGIENIPLSMERGETRWRFWNFKFSRGLGLPYSRDLATFKGHGSLTVMSRGRQVTYLAEQLPVLGPSVIGQGTLVRVLRAIPPAPTVNTSEQAGPQTERHHFGPDGRLGDPRRGGNPLMGVFAPAERRSGRHYRSPIRISRGNMDALGSRTSPRASPAAHLTVYDRNALKFYHRSQVLQSYPPQDLFGTLIWLAQRRQQLNGSSLGYLMQALANAHRLPPGTDSDFWQRAAGAFDFYLQNPLLHTFVPTHLSSTLEWLRANREALEGKSLRYLMQTLVIARRLPTYANSEYWERSAGAYDFSLETPLLRDYRPEDLKSSLHWLSVNREALGNNSLSYLMSALIMGGALPARANAEDWQRSAGAYDFYLNSPLLQSYQPVELQETLKWLDSHRAALGNNTLSYLIQALAMADRLPVKASMETWKRMVASYDFYRESALLQSYQPVELNATLAWLAEHRAELGGNSLSYLMQALMMAGKIPVSANPEHWQRSAGAYDRAVKEKPTITREIDRIWGLPAAPGEFRTPLARLKTMFAPELLPHAISGKVLSASYRNVILTFAWIIYGDSLVKQLVDALAPSTKSFPIISREEFASHGVNPKWLSDNFLPEIEARSVRQWEHLSDPSLPLQVRLFEINPDIPGFDSLFKLVGINPDQRSIGRVVGVVEHDARGDYFQVIDLELNPRYRFLYQMQHAITLFVLQGRISRLRSSDAPNDFARRMYERLSQDPRLRVRHVQINGKSGYYEVEKRIAPAVRERRSPALARAA